MNQKCIKQEKKNVISKQDMKQCKTKKKRDSTEGK